VYLGNIKHHSHTLQVNIVITPDSETAITPGSIITPYRQTSQTHLTGEYNNY